MTSLPVLSSADRHNKSSALSDGSIAGLALVFQSWFQRLFIPALIFVLSFAFFLVFNRPAYLPVFLSTALPAMAVLWASRGQNGLVLPIFPLYILIQGLAFTAPLSAETIVTGGRVYITPALLAQCSLPLAIWFPSLFLGWVLTPGRLMLQPRARALSDALQKPGYLPHFLIIISITFQWLVSSPFFSSFGAVSGGLRNPLITFATLALMVGSFVGTYAWSIRCLKQPILWLFLFIVPFYQGLASLLLSSNTTMLIAAMLGLWLGRSRHILPIFLSILLLLNFLHSGKAAMRERFWGDASQSLNNPIELISLWIEASQSGSNADSGENLYNERFNSLQNLAFIEDKLSAGVTPLGGESLSVIPQVLVPRIINSDKGRSHEGQVILNVHFGRQSREDTENTYISWGFLPEGVANFGSTLGPLLMGIGTGFLIRLSENIGRGQLILSTPGMMSLVLMVYWLLAYEIAASTFAAAIFQRIVAVLLVGWWFSHRQRPSQTV